MPARSSAVITVVAGRGEHLAAQQRGLARSFVAPDHYVVVAMDDPEALTATTSGPLAGGATHLHGLSVPVGGGLPLAAARNAGARAAIAAGADDLIFLDVDCVPSVSLLGSYQRSLADEPEPALHSGVVRYLPPGVDPLSENAFDAPPHPARPAPSPGETVVDSRWTLFWSLSFAVRAENWLLLNGFDEDFVGYGGEDTDLGFRAHRAGWAFRWLSDADAVHQHHPVERPPVSHLAEIVRNANLFHAKWGRWIMTGWLDEFAARGLAHFEAARQRWLVTR